MNIKMLKMLSKLSPVINKPAKFNPLRVFTKTGPDRIIKPVSNAVNAAAQSEGAYNVGGALTSSLPSSIVPGKTRLAPGRILAALGLGGGAAALGGGDKAGLSWKHYVPVGVAAGAGTLLSVKAWLDSKDDAKKDND